MSHISQAVAFARTHPPLSALDPAQVSPLQGVTSLNNRIFRIAHGGSDYVLRLASANGTAFGIRRDEELAAMRAAAGAGIAPQVVRANDAGDFILAYVHGRHWTHDDYAVPGNLLRLGRLIRALHQVPVPGGLGVPMRARLERMHASAVSLDCQLPEGLPRALDRCLAALATPGGPPPAGLNHNDLWANNVLDDGERLWIVDWEFAGIGDGLHDLNTCLISAGWDDGLKRDFLRACGHDPLGIEERLAAYQPVVHAFEGLWALVQHGLRGSAEHDYRGMAESHFRPLIATG